MGKYDNYIRPSLRDEANGYFILANEISEMNRLKRLELSIIWSAQPKGWQDKSLETLDKILLDNTS